LCGDGDTTDEALHSLTDAIEIQISESVEHGNIANLFSPADSKFFQMFALGKDFAVGEVRISQIQCDSISIEGVDAREYSDSEDDLVCA